MKTLSDVVTERLRSKIENGSQVATHAIEKILSDQERAADYLTIIGQEKRFKSNGIVSYNLPEAETDFSIHPHALRQFGEKLSVPVPYLRELASGDERQKALAATILNEHSGWAERNRVLMRSVGSEIRGVLSDQYKRLNSQEIITAFLSEVYDMGATMTDGHFTGTRYYIETLHPFPIIFPTPKNGDVAMAFGARLSSSDYGDGALDLRFFMLQGVCLNGMVRESVMRQMHLGSKLPDNLLLSQRTYQLDTETTVSALKDLTRQLFAPETIKRNMMAIQDASGVEVDITKELALLAKGGRLLKNEAEAVGKIVMQANPDDGVQGEATLWKLTQAISAHAREIDPSRSRDLQELAGFLMERVK